MVLGGNISHAILNPEGTQPGLDRIDDFERQLEKEMSIAKEESK